MSEATFRQTDFQTLSIKARAWALGPRLIALCRHASGICRPRGRINHCSRHVPARHADVLGAYQHPLAPVRNGMTDSSSPALAAEDKPIARGALRGAGGTPAPHLPDPRDMLGGSS